MKTFYEKGWFTKNVLWKMFFSILKYLLDEKLCFMKKLLQEKNVS
jgi:hypothetical protein